MVDDVDKTDEVRTHGGTYTFSNVTADHTISATFKDATTQQFTITASVTTGDETGSITPSGAATVDQGDPQQFTMQANSGYKISVITIDGSDKTAEVLAMTGNNENRAVYVFVNVQEDHTIEVGFVQNATGIAEVAADGIMVYPNPANGVLNVSNAGGKDISVYNVLGEVVKTVSNASTEQQIDVTGLVNGLYFVKVGNQVVKFNVAR